MQASDLLNLSRAQITAVNLDLPDDLFCEIGIAMVSDGGYPLLKPKLKFVRGNRQPHEVVFASKPPLEPLKGLMVLAEDLFAVYAAHGGPQYASVAAMERVANRAYTPLAKLELKRPKACGCSSDIYVDLKIGAWEGFRSESYCLMSLLGL